MSCFGGRDEQLYLIELTVDRLMLSAAKYKEELGSGALPVIKLKLIDFPVLVVERPAGPDPPQFDEAEGLAYGCGKSCLFFRKPRDLVAAMQAQPLKVGVFRDGETFPIAETDVPLSGCLCDQVTMVGNDRLHRPKPYEAGGTYNMIDPGKNPAGSIRLFFRLTFLGTHIISHYQLYEDSCVFKNEYDGMLRVTRVSQEDGPGTDDEQGQFSIGQGTVLAALRDANTPDR